jgi:hypothetical protein
MSKKNDKSRTQEPCRAVVRPLRCAGLGVEWLYDKGRSQIIGPC